MPRTPNIVTVGRRKTAIARLKVLKKTDDHYAITINDKDYTQYFPYQNWQDTILSPLKKVGYNGIALAIKVSGGGPTSQAGSVRHAIARALVVIDKDLKTTLKKEGLLTRDDRQKERKKPGLKKARRAPQWNKR